MILHRHALQKSRSFCSSARHRPPPSPQLAALPSVWSAVPTYGPVIRAPHVSSLTSQTLGVCGPAVRGLSSLVDPKLTEEPSWCICPSPHDGYGSDPWPRAQRLLSQMLEAEQQGTGRLEAIFIPSEWLKTPASGVPYLDEESCPKKRQGCSSIELPSCSECSGSCLGLF